MIYKPTYIAGGGHHLVYSDWSLYNLMIYCAIAETIATLWVRVNANDDFFNAPQQVIDRTGTTIDTLW